jgi:histidinol-phosphate phosphatase family protein
MFRSLSPTAVLLDRDGTLVRDVPYNDNPEKVEPLPGVARALDRLRSAGIPLAVVSNQSGVGRGLLRREDVDRVNRRVDLLLGPVGPFLICPHAPGSGCACRKPQPGLIFEAAAALGVTPTRCVVIGDLGADMEAATRAGARGILVPNLSTLPDEIIRAPEHAPDFATAVDRLLAERVEVA